MGAEQRDHHRAVGHDVAGQADVEHGEAVAAVAVIDPVLRGELDARGRSIAPKGISWTFLPSLIVVGKRAW